MFKSIQYFDSYLTEHRHPLRAGDNNMQHLSRSITKQPQHALLQSRRESATWFTHAPLSHATRYAGQKFPRSRVPCVKVSAFQTAPPVMERQETIRLPIDAYQVLGLPQSHNIKDSDINTTCDRLLAAHLEPAYSLITTEGRAELIALARADIFSHKSRVRERRDVLIPADLVPGALALLAEVGQHDLCLTLGHNLLVSGDLAAYPAVQGDVVLSCALARCSRAQELLQVHKQVADARNELMNAQAMLDDSLGSLMTSGLKARIQNTISVLDMQSAMDALKQPISCETAAARAEALATVKGFIRDWAQSSGAARTVNGLLRSLNSGLLGILQPHHQPGQHMRQAEHDFQLRQDSMEQLVGLLTAHELIDLADWKGIARQQGKHAWLYPGLLEAVTVAHIVHGFVQHQPKYMKQASTLAKQMQDCADMRVVHAVCDLLLGQTSDALQRLEEAAQMGPQGAQLLSDGFHPHELPSAHHAHAFVLAHSSGSGPDAALAGLCIFTERWLEQAAFPFFRDTASHPPHTSLASYFNDQQVQAEVEQTSPLHAVPMVQHLSETVTRVQDLVSQTPLLRLNLPTDKGVPAVNAVAAAMGLVGLAAVAWTVAVWGRRSSSWSLATPRQDVASHVSIATAATPPSSTSDMTQEAAEQLVRDWQAVKAQSYGAGYATESLPTILGEPLLAETQSKVTNLQAQGCHMRYRLHRLKVNEVSANQATKKGNICYVTATIDESAWLLGQDGSRLDSYRSTYGVVYKVMQGKDGSWKIMQADVMQ